MRGTSTRPRRTAPADIKRLTFDGNNALPHWSKSGKRIAFNHTVNYVSWINTMNLDGTGRKQLNAASAAAMVGETSTTPNRRPAAQIGSPPTPGDRMS